MQSGKDYTIGSKLSFGHGTLKAEYGDQGQIVDFTAVSVHPFFEQLTNLPLAQVVGKKLSEALILLEEDRSFWFEFYRGVLVDRDIRITERYFPPIDRWVRVQATPQSDDLIDIIFADTTQEQTSQTDLNRFFDLDLDLLAVTDQEGRFIQVNNAWKRVLGYSIQDLQRISILDITHPEDREEGQHNMKRLVNGHQISYYINQLQHADGHYVYLEWRARAFGNRIYASARNVTDRILRKQKQEYSSELESMVLKLAMEFIHLPPDQFDDQVNRLLRLIGEFADTDRGYLFLYDFTHNVCSNTHEWCAPQVPPEIDNLQEVPLDMLPEWVEAHQAGQLMHIPEVQKLDPESGLFQILDPQGIKTLITLPLIHEEECLGFVGFDAVKSYRQWSDTEVSILKMAANIITNSLVKHKIQQEMIKAREEAEAMSQAKSQFLANMSHEIRTPLNAVIGFTDLLKSTQLNNTQKQYVESANVSALSLMDIINEVLDFSKIEAGKLDLDPVETDMLELVEQTADMVKHNCTKKGLELLLKLDWNLPPIIIVDAIRLKQVLVNLLGNAVKFTNEGEVEFEVKLLDLHPEKQKARLQFLVRDTGIGISEEQRKRLFKAFSQAENSTSRRYGGTGLGLAISNRLLEMMNSALDLDSALGQGSTFSFILELPYRNSDEIRQKRLPGLHKVMVVDDNEKQRNILCETLSQWQVDHIPAANGLQALELLDKHPDTDVLIIDHSMPHISGLDTIQLIRRRTAGAQLHILLMYNGGDDLTIRETAGNYHVHTFLHKPIGIAELFQVLHQLPTSPQTHEPQHKESGKETSEAVRPAPQELLVLIAEDFPMNMLLLRTLLSRMVPQARIIEATNGREAFEAAQKHQPDLIFMDIQMPEIDGYAATQRIRQAETTWDKQPIIIALTASAIKGEREKCLAAGMNDYLTKPVQQNRIAQALETYLPVKVNANPA